MYEDFLSFCDMLPDTLLNKIVDISTFTGAETEEILEKALDLLLMRCQDAYLNKIASAQSKDPNLLIQIDIKDL